MVFFKRILITRFKIIPAELLKFIGFEATKPNLYACKN
jgi:hypothetical protein